jgi:hypothetical protein
MSKTSSTSPGELETDLQQALAGVQSVFQPGQTYLLGRVTYTGQQIAQTIMAWLALFVAASDAKTAQKTAIRQRRAIQPSAQAFLELLHALVSSQYGANGEELVKFGFKPKQPATPLTPGQRVIKQVKSEETRQKRGTLGSRQKKAVVGGTPPSVTVTSTGEAQIQPPQGGSKTGP